MSKNLQSWSPKNKTYDVGLAIGHLIVCQLWWEKIIGPMNEIDDTGGFSLGPVTMYTQLTQ
jgi:hypothetical protein